MQISSSLSLPFYSPLPITSPPPSPPPSLTFSSSASSFLGTTARIAPVTRPLIQGRSFVLGLGRRRSRRSKKGLLIYNALFGLGVPELVVIAGVAALVFGPKKLPEVGRSIGKTVKSFQQAAKEFESELKKEPESSSTSGSAMEVPKQASEVKEDEKVASKNESA